jgi:hypothetical protein
MKGIIAMKDHDQRFVVQAVNFSKAVRVRPITRIARLRNSYCVAIGASRRLAQTIGPWPRLSWIDFAQIRKVLGSAVAHSHPTKAQ